MKHTRCIISGDVGRRIALAAAILLGSVVLAGYRGEDPSLARLVDLLSRYVLTNPQGKVHLHLDKPYYAAGDDIWFKAYVLDARTNRPDTVSDVLYVELIDSEDRTTREVTLPLADGLTWGDISLADTLEAGNYRIRAYTRLMRSGGPDFFFDKVIRIGNTSAKPIAAKAEPVRTSIRFLPEGGHLIANLPQRIAVKALNDSGLGEQIRGDIIDADGNSITTFETAFAGMGSFMINADPDRPYRARMKLPDDSTVIQPLPVAQKSGAVLSVSVTDEENVKVKVLATPDLVQGETWKIIAQQQGTISYAGTIVLDKPVSVLNIPKAALRMGITQITLFSEKNIPLAERLVFVKSRSQLLAADFKSTWRPNGNVQIHLKTVSGDRPAAGSFSVSVTDETKLAPDEEGESNILASLLLTSDLKGYVEKPNHYFLNADRETDRELDNLMLTQGWRRFTWNQVLDSAQSPKEFIPERGLSISGTVLRKSKPEAGANVSLL